jgi:hypothetical protein
MTPKERTHRPEAERIAELEAKIAGIRQRSAAKQAKAAPEVQALIVARRAVDKAARVATEAGRDGLVRALEGAGATLSAQLIELGIRPREPRAKRGGRRKKGEAA